MSCLAHLLSACRTRARSSVILACLALLGPLSAVSAPLRAEAVELELILAVDVSLSVSAEEYALQMDGLARAFRHDSVIAAIEGLGDAGISVSLVQWGNVGRQKVAIGWRPVKDRVSALAMSQAIGATPRIFAGSGTAIADVMLFSLPLFEANPYKGRRRTIDISGDGPDNRSSAPQMVRDFIVKTGVTVNGLAILNEDPILEVYYRNYVIGGPGAFVLAADGYDEFYEAIVRKLVREISGQLISDGAGERQGTRVASAPQAARRHDMDRSGKEAKARP